MGKLSFPSYLYINACNSPGFLLYFNYWKCQFTAYWFLYRMFRGVKQNNINTFFQIIVALLKWVPKLYHKECICLKHTENILSECNQESFWRKVNWVLHSGQLLNVQRLIRIWTTCSTLSRVSSTHTCPIRSISTVTCAIAHNLSTL